MTITNVIETESNKVLANTLVDFVVPIAIALVVY